MLGEIEGRRRGRQRMRWLQLNAHESEQTPGDCERQGGLACCCLWDRRVGFDLASKQQ